MEALHLSCGSFVLEHLGREILCTILVDLGLIIIRVTPPLALHSTLLSWQGWRWRWRWCLLPPSTSPTLLSSPHLPWLEPDISVSTEHWAVSVYLIQLIITNITARPLLATWSYSPLSCVSCDGLLPQFTVWAVDCKREREGGPHLVPGFCSAHLTIPVSHPVSQSNNEILETE